MPILDSLKELKNEAESIEKSKEACKLHEQRSNHWWEDWQQIVWIECLCNKNHYQCNIVNFEADLKWNVNKTEHNKKELKEITDLCQKKLEKFKAIQNHNGKHY